jgi:membrane associated rhomboid family serine protease
LLSPQPEAVETRVVGDWGVVPTRLVGSPFSTEAVTLVTSMLLNGGWLHLGSNALALWILGDNVEDRLDWPRHLALCALRGIAVGLFQVASAP